MLADVRRGRWQPPRAEPAPEPVKDPRFHEFASQWFEANKGAWRPNTEIDYGWQLSNHLLPFFKDYRLSQITIAEVDRYRAAKLRERARLTEALADWQRRMDTETDARKRRELRRERPSKPLSAVSINKTITRLAQILEVAVEYGHLDRNPAKGKNRRVKAPKPAPVWLDRAEHIRALIDAAGELDQDARLDRQHVRRKATLATLVYSGLRIGELIDLRWRDVDLVAGRITVRASKTDAGVRTVDMLPVLGDELRALKAATKPSSRVSRVRHVRGDGAQPEQHPPSGARARGQACQCAAGGGVRGAAARSADAAQAAPHLRVGARGARRRSRLGDGPTRPHRSSVHPARVSAWDAPRPGREGCAARAGRRQ